jgi:tetratricopeptide (TPR) repeat protein
VAEGQQNEQSSGRVVGIVALCAAAAVAAIVGGTVLLSRNERTSLPPQSGKPVLQLELGTDTPLGHAAKLLNNGHAAAAAAIFRRYSTPAAKLGLAFARWTGPSSLASVEALAAASPDDPAVLLNLGWADYWAGQNADAVNAWQETASRFPDSPYAIDALDALNPGINRGLPPIIVDLSAVPAKARAALAAGVRYWEKAQVVSARQQFDAAARLAPNSPETLVAAAVALFSPDNSRAPFPQLGPLSGAFPHDSIVRLHLGLVLLWRGEAAKGKEQLRLAVAEQPTSVYAKQAALILKALG